MTNYSFITLDIPKKNKALTYITISILFKLMKVREITTQYSFSIIYSFVFTTTLFYFYVFLTIIHVTLLKKALQKFIIQKISLLIIKFKISNTTVFLYDSI